MTAFDSLKLHPNFFLVVPLIDISRSESIIGGTAVTLDKYLGIDKTLDNLAPKYSMGSFGLLIFIPFMEIFALDLLPDLVTPKTLHLWVAKCIPNCKAIKFSSLRIWVNSLADSDIKIKIELGG